MMLTGLSRIGCLSQIIPCTQRAWPGMQQGHTRSLKSANSPSSKSVLCQVCAMLLNSTARLSIFLSVKGPYSVTPPTKRFSDSRKDLALFQRRGKIGSLFTLWLLTARTSSWSRPSRRPIRKVLRRRCLQRRRQDFGPGTCMSFSCLI